MDADENLATPSSSPPPVSALSPAKSRARGIGIIIVVALCISGGLLAKSQLNQFADPNNFDPDPIPRPTKNAPFITTPDVIVDQMIKMGEITEKDMVYDLGCGDGRLVITAAVQRGCRGVGFDIDPQRVAEATENAKLHDVDKLVTITQGDVFKIDLREADVVLMYLLPQMLRDMVPQFEQCRPGTRLVSHDFPIEGLQADKTERVKTPGSSDHVVHLYVTPLKKLPPPPPRKYQLK